MMCALSLMNSEVTFELYFSLPAMSRAKKDVP